MNSLIPSKSNLEQQTDRRLRDLERQVASFPVRNLGGGAAPPASSIAAVITITNGQAIISGTNGIKRLSALATATNYPMYPGVPDDTILAVAVTNVGSGYTSVPTVSFTGGGGTGAAGTAVVVAGEVVGVDITNAGSGYTSAPTVAFTGGGGSGAAGTAIVADTAGNLPFADGLGYGSATAILGASSPTGTVLVAHDSRSAVPYALKSGQQAGTFLSGHCRMTSESASARGCIPVWIPQAAMV